MGTLNSKNGFTVIELLLYIALVAIILSLMSTFFATLLGARVKQQTVAEVEQQGAQALQQITQAIRNADAVTAPSTGTSATSITLNVADSAADPTVISLSGDAIRIQESVAPAVALTTDDVVVSALTFTSVSRPGTAGSVRVQFTISYDNGTGRNEYDFSKSFYATASLQ